MDMLFDLPLVTRRRERAARQAVSGADFLVNVAARELAERLAVVERQFD